MIGSVNIEGNNVSASILSASDEINAKLRYNDTLLVMLSSIASELNATLSTLYTETKDIKDNVDRLADLLASATCDHYSSEKIKEQTEKIKETLEDVDVDVKPEDYCNERYTKIIDDNTSKCPDYTIEDEDVNGDGTKDCGAIYKVYNGEDVTDDDAPYNTYIYEEPDVAESCTLSYSTDTFTCTGFKIKDDGTKTCVVFKHTDDDTSGIICSPAVSTYITVPSEIEGENERYGANGSCIMDYNEDTGVECEIGYSTDDNGGVTCSSIYNTFSNGYDADTSCEGFSTGDNALSCLEYSDTNNTCNQYIIDTGEDETSFMCLGSFSDGANECTMFNSVIYPDTTSLDCNIYSTGSDDECNMYVLNHQGDNSCDLYSNGETSCTGYSTEAGTGNTNCSPYSSSDGNCSSFTGNPDTAFCGSYSISGGDTCNSYIVGGSCTQCYNTSYTVTTHDEETGTTTITTTETTGTGETTTTTTTETSGGESTTTTETHTGCPTFNCGDGYGACGTGFEGGCTVLFNMMCSSGGGYSPS